MNAAHERALLADDIDSFVEFVTTDWQARMLLGFPAAPFILPMLASNMDATLAALTENPVLRVRLRHLDRTEAAGTWLVESTDARVELRFSLPGEIERWIADDPEEYRARRATFKQMLSDITVVYAGGAEVQIFRLVYDAADWRQG